MGGVRHLQEIYEILCTREECGVGKDDLMLLSVGEVNVNKNHQVIIKALGKLKNQKIHYCIAGVGNQKENLEKLANENNVNLHLLGFRSDINILDLSADFFAFPSKREGLGLAAVEAMSCGLPLITSSGRGMDDYTLNGINGYKGSADDTEGFKSDIEKICSSCADRACMGIKSMEISKKYDIANASNVMKRIYGEI